MRSFSRRGPRLALASIASLWLVGCEPSSPGVTSPPPPTSDISPTTVVAASSSFGDPLANLSADELARFNAGRDEFLAVESVGEGLGPVFNEAACATCHNNPVGGTTGRAETRFGRNSGGSFDPLANLGGSLLQDHAIGAVADGFVFQPEVVPNEANVIAGRITTQLFGLGLVDAVPDQELLQLARLEAAASPATGGTPSRVTEIRTGLTRVGRFGWKAQVPTLHQFSGDAYLNEMGITNPEFPDENCPQGDCAALFHNPAPGLNDDGGGVVKFTDFMTLLGPPPRGPVSLQSIVGSGIFVTIGCANCHTPVLATGDSPVPALSRKLFQPFSDFLLHDMGSLGDGIVQGAAASRQMRTAPLWGVRTRTKLLHDGRATSIPAAILAHDGQGRAARDRFQSLSPGAQQALLAFLDSL
jgi:CxxC motif-containing protein (DUF1111 family)